MSSVILGVRRPLSRDTAASSSASRVSLQDWPRLRDDVLKRDKFTCQYCGFKAQKFQRVHFRDGIPAESTTKNLATACIFCEQCCELESVARMHSGILIWLPELGQTDLHHLARALYATRADENNPDRVKSAQRVIDQLMARRTEAKKRLGTDDPMALATAMIEHMDDRVYAHRAERLAGIRLLPLARRIAGGADDTGNDQFPRILGYWTSAQGPLHVANDDAWQELANKID